MFVKFDLHEALTSSATHETSQFATIIHRETIGAARHTTRVLF